jgi:cell division septal protein FtsQ
VIDSGKSVPRLLGGRRDRRRRARASVGRIRRRRPRLSPRLLLGTIVLALVLAGGWLWFRDSAFVSVQRVSVTGVSGPDAGPIRRALASAALNMTTLDVSVDALRRAVAQYPVVKDLSVSTQFPHRIEIRVVEQIPVAAVAIGGRVIAVAADGTLLHNAAGVAALPRVPVRMPPSGSRLEGAALQDVSVLAAAPNNLLSHIAQVTSSDRHGLIAQLRNGPSIYFGDTRWLAAKWAAAVAVLGDPSSVAALYIDVSVPERPAAGGGSQSGSGSSGAGATSSTTGSATTAASATGSTSSAAGTTSTGASATSGTPPTGATSASSGG